MPTPSLPPRLLWVTYDFPPRQAAGAFRPVKLYKFLDKSRVEVEFLTSRAQSYAGGERLLDDVTPRPRVHRAGGVPLDLLFAGLKARLVGWGLGKADRRALWERIAYRLVLPFGFPDKHLPWGVRSALKALWLHLTRRFDAIYTTSFPESGHLPGLLLGSLGLPWVVDYRYGGPMWTTALTFGRRALGGRRLALAFQRLVLRRADLVITQSETLRRDFIARFDLDPARVVALPNGYDEDGFADFDTLRAPFERAPGEIHLLHVGGDWYPDEVQRAHVERLLDTLAAEQAAAVVLHAIGVDILGPAAAQRPTGFRYRYHGPQPHSEALRFLAGADAYLLSVIAETGTGSVAGWLPAKLWEYLRAGRPILLMGPRDDAFHYAEECGAAIHLGDTRQPLPVSTGTLRAALAAGATHPERARQHHWARRAAVFDTLLSRLFEGATRRT